MRRKTAYEIRRKAERRRQYAKEIAVITRLRDMLMRDFPGPDSRLKIIDAVKVLVR